MNSASTDRSVNPLLIIIFGAVCISFAPVFVKLVGEVRLGPSAIGFWRTLFGAIALFGLAAITRRKLIMPSRQLRFAALAGFVFYVDLFVWHRSVYYCGAGLSTILGNTQVFITAILSYFIFKEKLTGRFLIASVAAITGVVLLIGLATEDVIFTDRYLAGIAFGLATGVAYATYLIVLRWASLKQASKNQASPGETAIDFVVFMSWTSLFTSLFFGASVAVEGGAVLPPDVESLLLLISLGLVAQAFGWLAISSSLPHIAAARAGLILLLQPTLAMVWGVLIFSEQFTPTQAVGAALTLAAIYYGGLRSRK